MVLTDSEFRLIEESSLLQRSALRTRASAVPTNAKEKEVTNRGAKEIHGLLHEP